MDFWQFQGTQSSDYLSKIARRCRPSITDKLRIIIHVNRNTFWALETKAFKLESEITREFNGKTVRPPCCMAHNLVVNSIHSLQDECFNPSYTHFWTPIVSFFLPQSRTISCPLTIGEFTLKFKRDQEAKASCLLSEYINI